MPSELWDLFWLNRFLLNDISALAAESVKTLAQNHNVVPGIFTAIHTFGRDLKRNVHIHLSTTNGSIVSNSNTWKTLFFPHRKLKRFWQNKTIKLLKIHFNAGNLTLTPKLKQQLTLLFISSLTRYLI